MSSQSVIAVAVNPALDEAIQSFLKAMQHEGRAAPAYVQLMSRLTDRVIGLLMLEPIEIAQVSATQRKVVDFAVDTASKASSLLAGQIYGKRKNAEMAAVARDLEAMYWPAGPDNGGVPQLFYRVDSIFARDFRQVIDASLAGQGRGQMTLAMKLLDRLVDDIIQNYFLAQSRHIDMGFITRKTLDVSVAATRAAAHAVMHKVVKDFSDEQMKAFMTHNAQTLKEKKS